MNASILRELFEELSRQSYVWTPLTPDRLLEARAEAEKHPPLIRFFGLGERVEKKALVDSDFPEKLWDELLRSSFRYAVCGEPGLYVLHDHWPPAHGNEKNYAHVGAESMMLMRLLQERIDSFRGKDVLDLGCSSGILSFAVARAAKNVRGVDISARAVDLANATKEACGFKNLDFSVAEVGAPTAQDLLEKEAWDCAVSNPPMVIPAREAAYPHRDGGKLGIELPLKFLDFAEQALKASGEVFTLCTNPVVNGKNAFFEELSKRPIWEITEKKRLHSHFNQAVARKQGYADQGIAQVELWFLRLKKK